MQQRANTIQFPARRAFTLIELVVVLAVISILMAISLPALSTMWNESARSDAENQLTGWLRSARMRAIGDVETGVFFYLDNGVQKGVFIKLEVGDGNVPASDSADHFVVQPKNVLTLTPPFRVTPLAVLDDPMAGGVWNEEELANQNVTDELNTLGSRPGAQNHRNFFAIVFTPKGRVDVGRSVFIHEEPITVGVPSFGKTTGLPLGINISKFQPLGGSNSRPFAGALDELIANEQPENVALNFPSVQGVLIYNDSSFLEFPDGPPVLPTDVDKRAFLRQTGRPYYISYQNGAVVRGPLYDPADAS